MFKSHMMGPNFMTPEPVSYGYIGTQWVYEISTGTGILGEPMWGVSVIDKETGELQREMSELVASKQAAHEWVETFE